MNESMRDKFWTYPCIRQGSSWLNANDYESGRFKLVSLVEFITVLEQGPKDTEQPIQISGLTVKFLDDGSITIGCKTLGWSILETIHEAVHKPLPPQESDWQFDAVDPIVCKAILQLAEKHGWKLGPNMKCGQYIFPRVYEGFINGNHHRHNKSPLVSLSDAITRLQKGPQSPIICILDSYDVIQTKKGLKYLDYEITKQKIDEIYARAKEKKNAS
jgi:hypothetical protein